MRIRLPAWLVFNGHSIRRIWRTARIKAGPHGAVLTFSRK